MPNEDFAASPGDGYERYFGLAEAPFTLTSSPRFLFESASYLAAFKEIVYALSRREQIVVVTGPIGTGKTTLCRMIAERQDAQTVVAVIGSPPQNTEDLFRQVLDAFGLLTDDVKSIVAASRYGLQKVVQQFLDSLAALNAHAILVFDEAQHLPPDILEEIRLLVNLGTERQLLQIVLVGQPELDDLLARHELGQMEQRISRRHRLDPLQLAEVPAYVERRLRVAQVEPRMGDRRLFTDAAVNAIATLSRGVPRVVNILCDRSLENAWSDHTQAVDTAAVVRAARSLNIDVPPAMVPVSSAPAAPPVAAPTAPAPTATAAAQPVRATSPTIASPPIASPPIASPVAARPPVSPPQSGSRLPKRTSVRVKQSHVTIGVVAVLAVAAIAVWMVRGRASDPPPPASAAAPETVLDVARTAPAVRPSPGAPAPPARAAATPAASPTAQSPATADQFLIVVSSFRTRERSAQVAAEIVALGLPASTRLMSGWQQVVVGPYSSRQDAVAAQGRLAAAHFADTKITPVDR